MAAPEVNMTVVLNTFGLALIAGFQAYAIYRSKAGEKKAKAQVDTVIEKQVEIHKLVNQPMGIALAALATSQESVARMTRNEDDILAAVASRKASNEHNANQARIDAEKKVQEYNKSRIIEEFLAGEK